MHPLPQLNAVGLRNDFRGTGAQALLQPQAKQGTRRPPLGELHANKQGGNPITGAGYDNAHEGKAAGKSTPQGTWGFGRVTSDPETRKVDRPGRVVGDENDAPKQTTFRVSPTLASSPHLKPQLAMGGVGVSMSSFEPKKGRQLPKLEQVSHSTSSLPTTAGGSVHEDHPRGGGRAARRYDGTMKQGVYRSIDVVPSRNEGMQQQRDDLRVSQNAKPMGTARFTQDPQKMVRRRDIDGSPIIHSLAFEPTPPQDPLPIKSPRREAAAAARESLQARDPCFSSNAPSSTTLRETGASRKGPLPEPEQYQALPVRRQRFEECKEARGRGKRVRFAEGIDDDDSPNQPAGPSAPAATQGVMQLTGAYAFKNNSDVFNVGPGGGFKPHPGTLTAVTGEMCKGSSDASALNKGVPVADGGEGRISEVCRFLSGVPRLQGCGNSTLREIAKKAHLRKMSPGSMIVQAPLRGQKTPREVFFLRRGKAQCVRKESKRVTLARALGTLERAFTSIEGDPNADTKAPGMTMNRCSRTDICGSELVFQPADVFGQVAHHAQQTVRAVTEVEILVIAQKDLPFIASKLNSDVGVEGASSPEQTTSKPRKPPPRQPEAPSVPNPRAIKTLKGLLRTQSARTSRDMAPVRVQPELPVSARGERPRPSVAQLQTNMCFPR